MATWSVARWSPIAALLLAACVSGDGSVDAAPDRGELAGTYRGGNVAYLELEANGEYECLVLVGISPDGCGTFPGAGVSEGTWEVREGAVRFTPRSEPDDLVVPFSNATAVRADGGLRLSTSRKEHVLLRSPSVACEPAASRP